MKSFCSVLLFVLFCGVPGFARAQEATLTPMPDTIGGGEDELAAFCKSLLAQVAELMRVTIPAQEEKVRLAWEALQPLAEAEDLALRAYWNACFTPGISTATIYELQRVYFLAVEKAMGPRAQHREAQEALAMLKAQLQALNDVFFRCGC